MLVSIEPGSDKPIYLQLCDQLVAAIVRKELREGDALPSVRQFASELGINLHTVAKAYQMLQNEGYLQIFGRKGARVAALPGHSDAYLRRLRETIAEAYRDARGHGVDTELFREIVNQTIENGA